MRPDKTKSHARASANLGLLLALVLVAIPLAAATARIYVTNRGGTTISVIDPTTNTVVQTIRGLESPEVVRFSPDGNRLYIGLRSEDNLYVMDRKSGKTIKKIPTSGWVNDALVTSDGKLVLLAIRNTGVEAEDAGALDVIDAKSLTKIKSIPTQARTARPGADRRQQVRGRWVAGGTVHYSVRPAEHGHRLEVNYDQGVLPVVIETNPDGSGHRIFAQLTQTNGFSVVDFATHKEVARIVNPGRAQRVPSGMRRHQPRHRHRAGWKDAVVEQPACQCRVRLLAARPEIAGACFLAGNAGARESAPRRRAGVGNVHSGQQDRLRFHVRDQVDHRD